MTTLIGTVGWPQAVPDDIRHHIVRALHEHVDVDARTVEVTVAGDVVILSGCVRTWLQRDEAERAAQSAPGVARVDNRIAVESFHAANWEGFDQMC